MESPPPTDSIKCCDCGCDCSKDSWIRSVKRRHKDESERIPNNPRVHLENECELLRETVTSQQKTIQELTEELEKERNASSTAAAAAMSAMQRLQTEKAEFEMELRQFKVYAGEKMEYDQQEILALEDMVNQREQTVLALECETRAYKHRMMSYGLTEAEADGSGDDDKGLLFSHNPSMVDVGSEYDLTMYEYPPLKCNINENQDPLEADIYVAEDENYPPADTPHGREHLKTLDLRISLMETNTRPDVFVDSPRLKKAENVSYAKDDDSSEIGDDMSDDRVYTIDSVHQNASSHSGVVTEEKLGGDVVFTGGEEQRDLSDPDITKLYTRLQALEADRESMKQALLSMRTEKAQMVLLKEIAQHLSKDVVPQRRLPPRKASGPLTFTPVVKWIKSFVSWRIKARRSKYMFGMPANNMGLQMLLEKSPRSRKWRCLRSTQV